MRKLFTVLMVIGLGCFNNLSAQNIREVKSNVLVGEIKDVSGWYASIKYVTEVEMYLLSFKDMRYPNISVIEALYLGKEETVLNIKNALLDLLEKKENGKIIEIDLMDNHSIRFTTTVGMGMSMVSGNVFDGSNLIGTTSFWNKKKLNNLFKNL
jgi:hypothetical protein